MRFMGDGGLDAKGRGLKAAEERLLAELRAEDQRWEQSRREHQARRQGIMQRLIQVQNGLVEHGVEPRLSGMVVGQETPAEAQVRRQMPPDMYYRTPRNWG